MPVLIGIIICTIFMFLRKSNKTKLSKIKDTSKTNSLESEHKSENKNKQNKVHFYIGHTWDGLELFIKNKYGTKSLIAYYEELQNYGIDENDFVDLKINQFREIFLNFDDYMED